MTDLEQQLAKLQRSAWQMIGVFIQSHDILCSSNTSPDTESEHVYEEPPEVSVIVKYTVQYQQAMFTDRSII